MSEVQVVVQQLNRCYRNGEAKDRYIKQLEMKLDELERVLKAQLQYKGV